MRCTARPRTNAATKIPRCGWTGALARRTARARRPQEKKNTWLTRAKPLHASTGSCSGDPWSPQRGPGPSAVRCTRAVAPRCGWRTRTAATRCACRLCNGAAAGPAHGNWYVMRPSHAYHIELQLVPAGPQSAAVSGCSCQPATGPAWRGGQHHRSPGELPLARDSELTTDKSPATSRASADTAFPFGTEPHGHCHCHGYPREGEFRSSPDLMRQISHIAICAHAHD